MANREGLAPSSTSLKGWPLTPMRHGPWCPRLVSNQPPPACRAGALPMSYEGEVVLPGDLETPTSWVWARCSASELQECGQPGPI